jgi:ubiquinone/menaquinone biosynthesis C-methylase UbiE
MPIAPLWEAYASGGYDALRAALDTSPPETAADHFYLALVAYGQQDPDAALAAAHRSLELSPESLLFREAVAYLQRLNKDGKQSVYVTGEAFSAFIRGGGNVPLYQNVSAALKAAYSEYSGATLLDIGVGDGLALLAALSENIKEVTLVEPSAAMLALTSKALAERGVAVDAVNTTLQEFVKIEEGEWQIAQATFSLQAITPKERPPLLTWLRANAKRVLIAEFDPPEFSAMYAPERVAYVSERYEFGLAEYAGSSLVAQGFLMPIMFGYFDQTIARANYEQPIDAWVKELANAGFESIEKRPVFNYWWAPAYLIDAR